MSPAVPLGLMLAVVARLPNKPQAGHEVASTSPGRGRHG